MGMFVYAGLDALYSARATGLSWEYSGYLATTSAYGAFLGPTFTAATSAAILGADGGDIWEAVWKANVADAASFLAGPIIGGGVSEVLHGGEFEHGMSEGAYNAAAMVAIQSAAAYRAKAQARARLENKLVEMSENGQLSWQDAAMFFDEPGAESKRTLGGKIRKSGGAPYTAKGWIVKVGLMGAGGSLMKAPHPIAKAVGALMVVTGSILSLRSLANLPGTARDTADSIYGNTGMQEWYEDLDELDGK